MNSKVHYSLKIEDAHQHKVKVSMEFSWPSNKNTLDFFMPSWSPGSYLMREYGRFVRSIVATNELGDRYFVEQLDKGTWRVKQNQSGLAQGKKLHFSYEVYCHELTVRTSHVDCNHAFIHGPSVFMGIDGFGQLPIQLDLSFPAEWNKVTTGLKDVSKVRNEFKYESPNYDDFIDCPLEIGNHVTDGFQIDGKDHELAFFGGLLPHGNKVKEDMKTIVNHIASYMGGMPYDRYVFMTHLVPGLYGGLEHKNSTALQFSSMNFANRDDYINWMCLVSHEYFHTWNVKRIRPKTFGPFDYRKEAESSLLWLAEGLTSFMDELFVFQCGLITLEEYLKLQTKNFKRYFETPGRKFHSLEESGFNAWNTLYKPVENSSNSSVSYYLKGGIAFFVLNTFFALKEKSIKDFIDLLWERYLKDPENGMDKKEVLEAIENVGGVDTRELFENWIETTDELPIHDALKSIGLEIEYDLPSGVDLGMATRFEGDRVFVKSVELDRSAYRDGLNPEDEIIAINNMRVDRNNFSSLEKMLLESEVYELTISRLNYVQTIKIAPMKKAPEVKSILIKDEVKARSALAWQLK